MAAEDQTDMADALEAAAPTEKLQRMDEAISRVDSLLAGGDLEAAAEAAQDEQEWLSEQDCAVCRRLGLALVSVTMWAEVTPNVSPDAEAARVEAARESLARQHDQLLTEIEALT